MYTGLGVEPTTTALVVTTGVKLLNKWLGGPNPDTPEGWEESAYGGAIPCAAGKVQRAPPGGTLATLFPSWSVGYRLPSYNAGEIAAALQYAPEGFPGDPASAGTRQGLWTALQVPNELTRRYRSIGELANMAAYVANGRADCGVGWREEPAVEHLESILRRYRGVTGSPGGSSGGAAPTVSLELEYDARPATGTLVLAAVAAALLLS